MKRCMPGIALIALIALLLPACVRVGAAREAPAHGGQEEESDLTAVSVSEDSEVRGPEGFVILDGHLCHMNGEMGRPDRYEAGFHVIDGALYHVSEAGCDIDRLEVGLYEIDGGMYYVPERDGPFLADGAVGYLTFGADGRYTSGSQTVDLAVEKLLEGIPGDGAMSREEKLYAGFLRLRDGPFFYAAVDGPVWARGTDFWALQAAEHMFSEGYGTCFYWAAAFLYVARRLGFQAYPVVGGVGSADQLHAWVMVPFDDGAAYICDLELEWAYRHGFYQGPVTMDSMYKQPIWATNARYIFPGGMKTRDEGYWVF